MEQTPLIEFQDIHKIYHMGDSEVRAADGVSFRIDRGEFVAIVGQSGSGKSTCMNIIGCLDVPTSGRYLLGGTDVSTIDEDAQASFRNTMLGFIFQQYNLLPRLSVQENVELSLLYAKVPPQERAERARQALSRVGLADKIHHLPSQLSGGQQQRVSIDITNPTYTAVASARIYLAPKAFISVGVVIAVIALIVATLVLKYTRFGRNIYALGGSESSAQLMGLPTKKTKIATYMVSGFCSALAGVVYSLIMLSGYPLHAVGMEMDAIASSVIGGTLMSGGVAFLPGTLFGVLIQGIIQTFITFQGTLSAWWTRIIIALLLCAFIVMQTVIVRSRHRINSSEK